MDWGTFFSVFGLVFLAELGDKTQLAVFAQTCKYRRPWAVFAGASAALTVVTGLGVVGGQVLGRVVPDQVLRIVAAAAFIVMGVLIGKEVAEGAGQPSTEDVCENGSENASGRSVDPQGAGASTLARNWRAFGATFGLLFVAELGDKTQLAVLSMSSKHENGWAVLAGGALALTVVTAVGVVGGRILSELVSRRYLLWLAAVAFVAMGVLIGLGVL